MLRSHCGFIFNYCRFIGQTQGFNLLQKLLQNTIIHVNFQFVILIGFFLMVLNKGKSD